MQKRAAVGLFAQGQAHAYTHSAYNPDSTPRDVLAGNVGMHVCDHHCCLAPEYKRMKSRSPFSAKSYSRTTFISLAYRDIERAQHSTLL